MRELFTYDERLGIPIPDLNLEWDEYTKGEQQQILVQWENIRGSIPDRIKELESTINRKQFQLSDESNFTKSCQLNSEIAELASIINDLWLWYRTNQGVSEKMHN
ncbi:hypothetical protein QUF81_10165 [Peribacillus simplex]|uniref:Radical SAM protein n=1 Tax=Peribacillus simplex TaxID=1478 RepID=A0AAW7I8W5_9BACI|nr:MULTISPECIES: hypothetical protein [Peribacillus]SNS67623.1 hypothetical protein SAMN05444672_101539 [Bacillus sp. OK838]AMM94189.1 hypothetical protein UP17_18285 [Peribacillus simplex]MDF9760179.1 hypothetical protein [Peribacillus simplex]MDM5293542.1 hypothetical protein [Peribacillus simplex]MDM5452493.1 hypothetical protein [Peribacillus simplex]